MTEISNIKYDGFYDDIIKLYNDNKDNDQILYALFTKRSEIRFYGESISADSFTEKEIEYQYYI